MRSRSARSRTGPTSVARPSIRTTPTRRTCCSAASTSGSSLAEAAPRAEGGAEHPAPGDARLRFSLPLLEHVRSQKRFFRATIDGGRGARVRRRATDLIVRMVRVELARTVGSVSDRAGRGERERGEGDLILEARARCVAGAFLGLAAWWLEEGRKLDLETVDRAFQEVVGPRA